MGHDKAILVINGEPSARRLGALLAEVVHPALEVGRQYSGLTAITDEQPGQGPVPALVAGWSALSSAGHEGSVVVLACDLPLVTSAFIRWLAQYPGERSIVPLVDGRLQPLCARWSALDLRRCVERVAHGARSFRDLLDEMDPVTVGPSDWVEVAPPSALADADTPNDLERLGLSWHPGCSTDPGIQRPKCRPEPRERAGLPLPAMTPEPESAAKGAGGRTPAQQGSGQWPVTGLLSLEDARRFVLQGCRPLGPVEVPIDDALGHVADRAVTARSAVPPFATSAMDGYALRSADTAGGRVLLRVVGTVMAGDAPRATVGSGEAMRIMTGAAVPSGADAVCVIERCVVHDGGATVEVDESLSVDKHIRHVGCDIEPGDEVIGTATTLGPGHLGVLASLGIESVVVHARPRVGVLSTGDELVDGATPLRPGMIPDANRHTLLSQIRQSGWPAIDLGIVGDDKDAVAAALREGAARCDALVTSGGVSVGDLDVVKLVLDDLSGGTMRWMQVAIKPAKPLAFGHLAATGTPVFGLPGNPVSAMVSFELFARPALRRMAGHGELERPTLTARATTDLPRRRDGKVHFVLARAARGPDGGLVVGTAGGKESHRLRAMADANALAVLPNGEGVKGGEAVEIMLLEAELLGLAGDEGSDEA